MAESPFQKALAAELAALQKDVRADFQRQVDFQLGHPLFFAPTPPPSRLRRAWLRATSRPRRIAWRLRDAWSVLRHGLPEDW